MKKYIEQLKVRNRLSISGLLGMTTIISLSGRYIPETIQAPDFILGFIEGFQLSIFVALAAFFVFNMIKVRKALQDETKLEEMYIKENDERNAKIAKEVGKTSSLISLIGLAIATIMSGYINYIVFLSLLGVLLFSVTVKSVCKIYYKNKY